MESKGYGTVHSYTAIHYPEIPPFDYPNCIVLVDMDEGVRLAAQITEVEPEDLEIGMRVKANIQEVQENLSLPVFEAATEGTAE